MTTGSIESDLELNFKDFKASGDYDFEKGRYNPAIASHFKAIAVLCDLKIYQERGLLPKNHNERFLFLNIHFPAVSKIVSLLFKKYTDSYNLRVSKKESLDMKENVEKIKTLLGFSK